LAFPIGPSGPGVARRHPGLGSEWEKLRRISEVGLLYSEDECLEHRTLFRGNLKGNEFLIGPSIR
jgi:hypothetical protein